MYRFFSGLVLFSMGWAQTPDGRAFDSPADLESAGKLWAANCSVCHGPKGKGGRGSDLTTGKFRHGSTGDDLYRAIRNGLPGTEMPGFPLSDKETLQVVSFVRTLARGTPPPPAGGDATRGRAVFAASRQGCLNCHRAGSEGAHVAPNLSGIGARLTPAELQAALLHPDERVRPEHWYVRATTRDGKTVTGRRLNEDTYSLQLIDAQDRLVGLMKDDLKTLQFVKGSLMPSYEGKLTQNELNDVVAYLASLKAER